MKVILKITTVLLASILFFTACKKSAGPKGDTGAAGAQGPAGNNNITVQTFTTATSDWTTYSWPYNYVEAVLTVPAITSTVVSSGDVHVYMLDATGTMWMGMPYSYISNQYNYKYKAGQVILDLTLSNNTAPMNPGTQQFKVVVIPPALIKKYPNVNWNDYNSLQKFLKD
jgi:hypothetical protein